MSVICIITTLIVEVCVLKSIEENSYAGFIVRPTFWYILKPTNTKPNAETSRVKA